MHKFKTVIHIIHLRLPSLKIQIIRVYQFKKISNIGLYKTLFSSNTTDSTQLFFLHTRQLYYNQVMLASLISTYRFEVEMIK